MQIEVHQAHKHKEAVEYCSMGCTMSEAVTHTICIKRIDQLISEFDCLPILAGSRQFITSKE